MRLEFTLQWAAIAAGSMGAAQVARADEKVTYADHVRPLLANRCLSCHNAERLKGGLDLSAHGTALAGSSGGPVITPGDPDASALLAVVMHRREPFMPPSGGPLSEPEIDLIRRWIVGGCLETATSSAPKPATPPPAPIVPSQAAPAAQVERLVARYPLADVVTSLRAGAVLDVAAHPTLPLAAVAGQKQVLLFDLKRMELAGVLPFPPGFPNSLRFSRSGRLLVAGGGEGARRGGVVVWSVADGRRLGIVGDEPDAVLACDIDPAERHIAAGGPSRIVKVHSLAEGKLLHRIDKHTDWVTAAAYSPDGVLLATADRGGNVHLWEADSPASADGQAAPLAAYQTLAAHPAAVTALAWRADSNLLATACEDGRVRWFEISGGAKVKEWPAHEGGCLDVRFAADGRLVTAGRDRQVKLWDAGGASPRALGPMSDAALCAALTATVSSAGDRAADKATGGGTSSGERIIAGDWAGLLRVWSAADGAAIGDLPSHPPGLAEQLAAAQAQADAAKVAHDQAAASRRSADEAVQAAQAAAGQAALAQNAAAEAMARAEARRAKFLAAELRARVDAAGEKLTAEQARLQPVLDKSDAAAAAVMTAVASLDAARAELAGATTASGGAVKAVESAAAAVLAAKKKSTDAGALVAQREATVKEYAASIAALRQRTATVAEAPTPGDAPQATSQPATSQPASTQPATPAPGADDGSDASLAAAIAKAAEALSLLEQSLAAARDEAARAEQVVSAVQAAETQARQSAAAAEARQAELAKQIAQREAALSAARSQADADATAAAEARAVLDAAQKALADLQAEYDRLINQAAAAVEL